MKKILLGFIAIGLFTFVGCVNVILTDADGNKYKTVVIGEQKWMAENLRTTKYADGSTIPNVTDNTKWKDLTTGAWSHYDSDSQYDDSTYSKLYNWYELTPSQYDSIYGKLYNWYTLEKGDLCPKGWHVPSNDEWTMLRDYLAANDHDGKEGVSLKSKSGWNIYCNPDQFSHCAINGNGTDDYGWNGLPGGSRHYVGDLYYFDQGGFWWSSSEDSTYNAWYHYLYFSIDSISNGKHDKGNAFSVRCIKD